MWSRWLWVLGSVVACSGRPVPTVYDATVKAPPVASVAAAPVGSSTAPHDDPATCVESPEPLSSAQVARGPHMDGMSAKLKPCTAGLREAGFVRVHMTPRSGGGTNVAVEATNLLDYHFVACVKRVLERSTIKDADSRALDMTLRFQPDGAPERTERTEDRPIAHSSSVTGDQSPTSGHQPPEKESPTSGRLPPEKIRDIVRASFERFRKCYEVGLERDPRLTGRVSIRFLIDRDGKVSSALVAGNTLPDCAVTACVRDAFKTLTFPEPQGGIVTVVYPIFLEPG